MTKPSKPDDEGEALPPGAVATMREWGWSEAQIEAQRRQAERIRAAGGFRAFVRKQEAARIMAEATGVPVEVEHLDCGRAFENVDELLAHYAARDEQFGAVPVWWCSALALERAQPKGWNKAQQDAAAVQFMRALEAHADALTLEQYPTLEPWPKGQPLPPRWRDGLFLSKANLRAWAREHAPHWLESALLAEPAPAEECPAGAGVAALADEEGWSHESVTNPSVRLLQRAREIATAVGDSKWRAGIQNVSIREVAPEVAKQLTDLGVKTQRGTVGDSTARGLLKGWSYKFAQRR